MHEGPPQSLCLHRQAAHSNLGWSTDHILDIAAGMEDGIAKIRAICDHIANGEIKERSLKAQLTALRGVALVKGESDIRTIGIQSPWTKITEHLLWKHFASVRNRPTRQLAEVERGSRSSNSTRAQFNYSFSFLFPFIFLEVPIISFETLPILLEVKLHLFQHQINSRPCPLCGRDLFLLSLVQQPLPFL
jgi:hypothetical protein